MIKLKTLNKKQLEDFVSSGEFKQYDFLPITEHRALSHINNPKATDEQILLILAFYNEKLAGYLGCFPDRFVLEEKEIRYAWLSTLYVSEEFRGKKIAKRLLEKAMEIYEEQIAITEFTQEAETLYKIMGSFEYILPKRGKRFYFNTDLATIIPDKKPNTNLFRPFFSLVDFTANSVISIKNMLIRKPDFHFEILDHIDGESADFVNGFQSRRNANEINLSIKYPWVLKGERKDEKYLFSSYAENFKYFWIKVYDHQNSLTVCSLLLLRDGYLKIPYLFSQSGMGNFIDFLSYFVVKNKIKALTSYQHELNKEIEHSKIFPKIYERDFERRYLFHKQLLQSLPEGFNPHYQDGDGDCMMT
ncbi:GNAT family N-acetyltransferase [Chryseobacterium jejuense]|uniref:Acetyltransferase (GNAT) domain-containing protein n=1 Tax=Chryseobacterium jejuense TaxID=445960 RepID=A0A2X2YZ62_CHRJE|nr:GNAT family N-acetyltransferase [Chryseobacterium jejuense]SDJ91349.1 Acetyltransferase (GNAT) domain-containing protein [Chryseobacterium jejuense]SQB42949.1 Acetyltransferase (GNAT) family [Chryseobacterium jejuense]